MRTHIVALLRHGRKNGEIARNGSLTDVASCLLALIDGLIVQQWVDPKVKISVVLKKALPIWLGALKENPHG